MKTLSWNVKGCNASDKIRLIKRCLDQSKPDLVFFQETKIKEEDFASFKNKFRRWECLLTGALGASGGMAILWKPKTITISESISNTNWQWTKVYVKHLQCFFMVINVYGLNNNAQKRMLWQSIAGKV